MRAIEIKKNVDVKGYVHLPFPNNLSSTEVLYIFGPEIFTTLIKENPKSSRLLSSNLDVDLHTDHIKAKYIAWQCNSQAASGGESVLLDGFELLNSASKNVLDALQKVLVKSHRLFLDDKPLYPLYSLEDKVLYYAPFLCESPIGSKEKQSFDWFKEKIKISHKTEIKLSEGDWLIIDNHRMLHGRKGFLKNSNRLLTRYWLSGKVK